MKKCSNCGAEYDSGLLKCPYCEFENTEAAQQIYHEKIDELAEKRQQIRKLPEKLTKRRTKVIFLAAVVFLAVGIVMAMGIRMVHNLLIQKEIETEEKNKKIMEELLAEGDYEGFCQYYEESADSFAVYEKYWEIKEIYYWYQQLVSRLESNREYFHEEDLKEVQTDIVAIAMETYSTLWYRAQDFLDDHKCFGNEEHIREICEMAETCFQEEYRVGDAILEEIKSVEQTEGAASARKFYRRLAEEVVENLWEQ